MTDNSTAVVVTTVLSNNNLTSFDNTTTSSLHLNESGGGVKTTTFDRTRFEAHSWLHLSTMSTSMLLIIIAAIVGNVFVIAAIAREKNLKSVQNYLILSLSVADLMVAALVMPLALLDQISKNWFLGPELCDLWISLDVVCCTSSILHLVCIALDRYWSVTRIDYMHTRTARRVCGMIAISWIISVLISVPPLLGWKDDQYSTENTGQCIISQHPLYTVYSTMGAFYVPLLLIIIIYLKIYNAAKSSIRKRHFQAYKDMAKTFKPRIASGMNGQHNTTSLAQAPVTTGGNQAQNGASTTLPLVALPLSTSPNSSVSSEGNIAADDNKNKVTAKPYLVDQIETEIEVVTPLNAHNGHDDVDDVTSHSSLAAVAAAAQPTKTKKHEQVDKRQKVRMERERKAARTLAIITGTFIVCWLPFFTWSLARPFCAHTFQLPDALWHTFVWLGYLNSLLNPVIYTVFNPDFRAAFKHCLCKRS